MKIMFYVIICREEGLFWVFGLWVLKDIDGKDGFNSIVNWLMIRGIVKKICVFLRLV